MALYAFDGTWNTDHQDDSKDTNVVRFKELYIGDSEYRSGVGTRMGVIGRVVGGILGAGGRARVNEMYDALCANWAAGDEVIDLVGFSRGAALAVHFANRVQRRGIQLEERTIESPEIRFLGLFDLVGSFGLSFDNIVDFQSINLGWNIETLPPNVLNCFHAMALDERRESFKVTRLSSRGDSTHLEERWFRGVHSDVGGGNENPDRSNIAMKWMFNKALSVGLPMDTNKVQLPKYSRTDVDAPVSVNRDFQLDPPRTVRIDDTIDPSAMGLDLQAG